MEQEFATIRNARAWLKDRFEARANERIRDPSPNTITGYSSESKRLMRLLDPWAGALDTVKRETFFRRRAALLHVTAGRIDQLLSGQDRLQRAKDTGPEWRAMVSEIGSALALVLRVPSGDALAKTKRRETKKKGLSRLPENWPELMVKRMPKYRAAVQILALTGCRPSELVTGVQVERIPEAPGGILIKIRGAKVGEFSGQEWRVFQFLEPFLNPIAAELAAEMKGQSTVVNVSDARALSGAVRAAGQRAFPGHPESITPYSFRHQIASDFKAAGYVDALSQALGHASSETRLTYGSPRHGRSAMLPSGVDAARPVRQIEKPEQRTQGERQRQT